MPFKPEKNFNTNTMIFNKKNTIYNIIEFRHKLSIIKTKEHYCVFSTYGMIKNDGINNYNNQSILNDSITMLRTQENQKKEKSLFSLDIIKYIYLNPVDLSLQIFCDEMLSL